ncbi:MAG TPA: ThiF family adenylyltransferase [Blastocatellia bacterium]|nr:ThiF family adenylyltransferase [Blastocatellia bacterium]
MISTSSEKLVLREGRFSRLEAIQWWDQSLLRRSRVLVVGAGALGNEVIKNLSLLGIGNLVITDMDRVELSNLSRSVLFRESDEGAPKAEAAASSARQIYPEIRVTPIVADVLAGIGLGFFRWADVVVGALDNREARVFVNSASAMVGKPWIDGGIEVLQGIVRGFAPPATACYECTMSSVDWDLLNKRRSCSLLARRALAASGTPTTPTTASVIGAIQAQEVVKLLHGMDALVGRGFVFEGTTHGSYSVNYQVSPDCGWHEPPPRIESCADLNSNSRIETICERASGLLGGLDAIDLVRDMVEWLNCPSCGERYRVLKPVEMIGEDQARCPGCRSELAPVMFSSVSPSSDLVHMKVEEIGLPGWDILWARRGQETLGIELAGDRPLDLA